MKKRVLSLLMAVTLCFSTVPMTALAQEADATTEQETTVPETSPEPQSDVTVYEADNSGEDIKDISGGDAGADSAAQGTAKEKDAAVQAVQALIDALPETVTEENAESVSAQLEAIAEAMDSLTEEQIAELDMKRYETVCAAPIQLAAVQAGEHTHYLCGEDTCNGVGHTEIEKVTFQPWYYRDSLPTKAGNYYLMYDVNMIISRSWEPADGTILCLNGKTITVDTPTPEGMQEAIWLFADRTLTLCDCCGGGKITHAEKSIVDKNTDIAIKVLGTFNMYGGNITGNTARCGAGVVTAGTFNMYGGSITNNMARYDANYTGSGVCSGGGVSVGGGTFNMFAGEITGNKGENGAGVSISNGTFNMEGGIISGNTAARNSATTENTTEFYGGGVYITGGTFNMTGGEITGNTAGSGSGVYVAKDGCFTVSGSAKISGNNGSNVYLPDGATITIGEGGLADNARIGVTTEKTPAQNSFVAIATGAADGGYKAGTFIDDQNSGYEIRQTGDMVVFANGELHEHPICGAGCEHTGDEKHVVQPWRGISSLNEITADGGSITLDYPFYLVYDRNAKNSKIKNNGWQGLTVNENDITYKTENGTPLDGAPVNAGTYVANISLKGADNKTATASLEFTIGKGLLTVKVDSNLCKVLYGEEFKFPDNAVSYEGFVDGDSVENALRGELTYDTNYEPGDNVGDKYGITLGGLTSDNYIIEYKAGSLTVIPRTVSFSWENTEDRTYGDGKGEITVSVEGLLGTDDVSAVVEDAVLTVGTHTARVTGLTGYQARDYKLPDEETERTCTYTVAKAAQTLKYKASEANIIYYEGLEYPNTLDTSGCHTAVTYISDKPEVAAVQDNGIVLIVGAGTARITATAAEGDNYNSAEASFTLNVAKCPVIISGVRVDDKIYDGNPQTTFHIDSAEIKRGKGIVGEGSPACGDVKIDITNATATFEDANAGTDKTVTFNGFALTGAAADNYILSEQPAATAAITPATITVTPKAGQVKTYGENDPELTYTCSGAVSNETPSFNGALRRTFGETVGSYAINLGNLELKDNTDGNFRADNYKLELSNEVINFTINMATPIITVIPKTLVKNGVAVDITNWASFNNTDPDAKLTYALVGSPEGISLTENNKLTAANADTTADSFTIKVTAEATTNFNAPTEETISVTVVLKEDADVKIEAPVSKTYGDADFALKATTIATDNGVWNWTSSNESILQIVSGGDTATPVIRVRKADADGAALTATYTSDAYYGTASVTIKVDPKAIAGDMISEIPAQEYTGSEIKPAPEVKDGGKTLTPGGDFDFDYSANTNAGEATLTITGKGNYTGTAEKKFTISRKDIKGANIELVSDSFTYNGEEQTVEIASVTLPDGTDLNGNYKIIDNSNKATDAAKEIILTIEGTGNYTGTAATVWEITRIDPKQEDFDVAPDLTAELTYNGEARIVTVTTKAGIRGMGAITVKYNGSTETPVNAGSYAITIDIGEGGNYKAATGIAAGTLTIQKAAAPTLAEILGSHEYATTGEQTISTAALVADATGYALGEIPENEIVSQVSVSADGALKYTLTGKAAAGSAVTIPVTITSANYEDATVNVVITITKATPTGEPGYNEIHDSSKTLADAGLELINSTLNPKEGTLEWIDSKGNVLPSDTKMEEGKKYIWRFTPADPNYGILTGEVELYAPYRIIDGADSSWTQDTSGSIAIRGNGDFAKFQSVKVDGNLVDPSNYTVTEGSTIITLKADYLKTLSEGSHTFELVWTDGSASTNFTVTANTSDDKNDDDDSDDSGNTGSNHNAADSGNTNQTLITAPKTGDLSGLWITLFAISLAGLAGMLVRRKNNK